MNMKLTPIPAEDVETEAALIETLAKARQLDRKKRDATATLEAYRPRKATTRGDIEFR